MESEERVCTCTQRYQVSIGDCTCNCSCIFHIYWTKSRNFRKIWDV